MKGSNSNRKFLLNIILLFIFLLIVITFFTRFQLRQEEKSKRKVILYQANQLVSLITLHNINDFETDKKDFLLKTIMENNFHTGLVYCFVHDHTGKVLASFASNELVNKIPNEIRTRSFSEMMLTKQTFYDPGSGQTIYEYSKPIFEDGQRTGTVRLGLITPPVLLFPPEQISLLAMFIFSVIAAVLISYYGVTLAIRPVQKTIRNFEKFSYGSVPNNGHSEKGSGIAKMVKALDHSYSNIQERFSNIESENIELSTKIGAISFEKNQVINLLDSMNFGIITIDLQDNIIYMNNYMRTLLGRQLKDVLYQQFDNVVGNDEIASFVLQQETIGTATTAKHIETTFPDLLPGEFFQVSCFNLVDNQGETIGKIILVKNITNEKLGEKTQQEFISHVSHELLTPLTTIKSYNEMLMDGEIDKKEMQKEFYNTISDETARLTRLIQNLLNISKIETGSLTINKGLIRTELLFEDCVSAINASALNKNITFEKDIPDKFPSLCGDKDLLKVAINNVLNNAVKYTPEGGTITFSLKDHNNTVTFDVVDTGFGISEKDKPHVFDKSYRSTDQHISEQSGSGLGLAITAEIIQLHGGEIEVQSETGKGTHFTINIPKEEYNLGD